MGIDTSAGTEDITRDNRLTICVVFTTYRHRRVLFHTAFLTAAIDMAVVSIAITDGADVRNSSRHENGAIEYKAPEIEITQHVFDQITVYNRLLHVDYLVVSNGLQHFCCRMDYEKGEYSFLQNIPHYMELT